MSTNKQDVAAAADRAEARSAEASSPDARRDLDLESPEELQRRAKIMRAETVKLESEARRAAQRRQAKAKADADAAQADGQPQPPSYEFRLGERDELWPEIKRNGEPIKGSMLNAVSAIERLNLTCRRDTFLNTYIVQGPGMGNFVGELDDALVRKFRELSFERLLYEPGKEAAYDALLRKCEENSFNSLTAQLDELQSDGVPRLDPWLTTYLGENDTPLHRQYARLVLMAAVRRAYDPGVAFQHVLVLEGPEGVDKSSTVKVLASGQAERNPPYFSDSPILHKAERDQQELTKGVWFYEIAELAGMRKADAHMVKNFVTKEAERARAAYERFQKSQPRVAIFIGTFNTDANTGQTVEYLNAGDRRRWWPVRVAEVSPTDLAALQRDRWQLFAEALAQHTDALGEREWKLLRLPKEFWEAAAVEQKEREVVSPLVDRLSNLYDRLRKAPKSMSANEGYTGTPGEDFIVDGVEVWVSSKFIVELVGRWDASGRGAAGAMGALGWSSTNDTRGSVKSRRRGYVHPVEDEIEGEDVAPTYDPTFDDDG
jgi:predicted P-loop ATPase